MPVVLLAIVNIFKKILTDPLMRFIHDRFVSVFVRIYVFNSHFCNYSMLSIFYQGKELCFFCLNEFLFYIIIDNNYHSQYIVMPWRWSNKGQNVGRFAHLYLPNNFHTWFFKLKHPLEFYVLKYSNKSLSNLLKLIFSPCIISILPYQLSII